MQNVDGQKFRSIIKKRLDGGYLKKGKNISAPLNFVKQFISVMESESKLVAMLMRQEKLEI